MLTGGRPLHPAVLPAPSLALPRRAFHERVDQPSSGKRPGTLGREAEGRKDLRRCVLQTQALSFLTLSVIHKHILSPCRGADGGGEQDTRGAQTQAQI